MLRSGRLLVGACSAVAALAACASGAPSTATTTATASSAVSGEKLSVELRNAAGAAAGTVELRPAGPSTEVAVKATGLSPGFHGMHVHTIGKCEPGSADPSDPTRRGDFLSSGGHFTKAGAGHPSHEGDLPSLLAGPDGAATVVSTTDRFTVNDLRDADGSALVVHAQADNFANIPTRYTPVPDEETRKAGDAGGRVACGVIAPR